MTTDPFRWFVGFALLVGTPATLAAHVAPVKVALIPGEGDRAPKAGVVELLTADVSKWDRVVVLEREAVAKVVAKQKLSANLSSPSDSGVRARHSTL
jgi:hypothetical protein